MKLVVFDCDGTLIDSQNIIVAAMEHACASLGIAAPDRAQTLSIVGLSLSEAFHHLMPDASPEQNHKLVTAYKLSFKELRMDSKHHEPFFDGAVDVIAELSARADVVMGIATGKSQRGMQAILQRDELRGQFVTVQTADDAASKPAPQMLFQAMSEAGVAADHCVMIGDTSYDMEMARAAGAHAIGVSWGYHRVEDLQRAGAHAIANDFKKLMELIGVFASE